MPTSVNLSLALSAVKQVAVTDPTQTSPSINQNINATTVPTTMNANSTPDATESWSRQLALVAGVLSLDLTALVQDGVSNLNATGKKLRAIGFYLPADNAGNMQIGTGASNGYSAIGVLGPFPKGAGGVIYLPTAIAVDGTHKILDLAGSGTDKINVMLVFGT